MGTILLTKRGWDMDWMLFSVGSTYLELYCTVFCLPSTQIQLITTPLLVVGHGTKSMHKKLKKNPSYDQNKDARTSWNFYCWGLGMALEKGSVCVTGAGGYLASWVVKLLLSKDYLVHGTVRDPADDKNAHLMKIDQATENLKLFKADLLDYSSLSSAIQGCRGVFHVASPVPFTRVSNPEVEVIEPAVKGTLNVLKACAEAKVKRVVIVSSGSAVLSNPSWPKGQVMDENCWSDKEYCRATKNWYNLSKTEAESEAWEYAKRSGLDVVAICPSLILGPILQSTVNASTMVLIKILKDGCDSLENKLRPIIDVRDVTEALLLAYETPEAEGRYICTAHAIRVKDLVEKLRSMYPNYNYPKSFTEEEQEAVMISSEKLQRLGWSFRSLEETLIDSVENYQKIGLLD